MDIEEEHREDEEESGGGWLTTWADMMSVLLTFFIVLQAFSTISEKKFYEAVSSIQRAFAIPLPIRSPGTAEFRSPETAADMLQQKIADEDVAGVSVEDYGDHLVLTIDSELLFRLGKADLTAAGRQVMADVSEALAATEGRIRVEGHTCDLPLGRGSEFRNNWWLSAARALTALEALEEAGIPSERLAAAGYGEFDPVAPNDSEENRRKNRRVEFVIEKRRRPADGF